MAEDLQIRTRFSDFKRVDTPTGNMFLVGYNPNEPNLAQQNSRYALEAVRNFFLTGVPPSPGKWVEQPSIEVVDNGDGTVNIIVSGGSADWGGYVEPYEAVTYLDIILPVSPLQQLVAIAALEDGAYEYKAGLQNQNPATPPISTGALLVNYVLLNSAGGEVTVPVPAGVSEERLQEVLKRYLPLLLTEEKEVEVGPHELAFTASNDFEGGTVESGLSFSSTGMVLRRTITDSQGDQIFKSTAGGWKSDQATVGELGEQKPKNVTAWTWEFARMQRGGHVVYYGPFAAPEKSGWFFAFVNQGVVTTYELSDNFYLNGEPFSGGGGGKLYPGTGQNTDGAMTQKAATDSFVLKPGSGAIAPVAGVLTIPIGRDGVYSCGTESGGVTTYQYPTSVQLSGTPYPGVGVVMKIRANGTPEPVLPAGLTRHNDSRNFNAANGTLNGLRIFREPNSSGAQTNFYIWTQQ